MTFYYFMGKHASTFPLAIPSASSCFCRESPSSGFRAMAETFLKQYLNLIYGELLYIICVKSHVVLELHGVRRVYVPRPQVPQVDAGGVVQDHEHARAGLGPNDL